MHGAQAFEFGQMAHIGALRGVGIKARPRQALANGAFFNAVDDFH
jgi:hypothetical protein